ncbi:ABC transporter permease, partial [Escherichia coli]|nr:ABC transporter permease [Escherichia coli]
QNDVTLKMPAFEWVHVQLHQQKGMISLSPPTICNSAAALVASAMGIASLMTSTIMERAKEIGLMKALGARQWQIMLLFYLEAASSGLAGGALGCIAGWGLAKAIGVMLFDAPLNFAWIVVPCVLVIAVLIALIGTWFPARRIARLYPVEVLYGR